MNTQKSPSRNSAPSPGAPSDPVADPGHVARELAHLVYQFREDLADAVFCEREPAIRETACKRLLLAEDFLRRNQLPLDRESTALERFVEQILTGHVGQA